MLTGAKGYLAIILTVGLFCVLVNLGLWQWGKGVIRSESEQRLHRYSERHPLKLTLSKLQDLFASHSVENLQGIVVSLDLSPSSKPTLLLDNITFDGKVGYQLFQPMHIRDDVELMERTTQIKRPTATIMVDLGFVIAPKRRDQLPTVHSWLGGEQILGRLYRKESNPLSSELQPEFDDPIRVQNLHLEQLGALWGANIEPLMFQPLSLNHWDYPQIWKPNNMTSEKHFGYAFQWFAMASVLALISVRILIKRILLIRRVRDEKRST